MEIYLKLSSNERILVGEVPHDSIDATSLSLETGGSELNDFMTLVGKKKLTPVPQSYQKMCKALGLKGKAAAFAIPKEKLETHLKQCLGSIQDALCDKEDAEYLITYLMIKRFLQGLSSAHVDKSILSNLIKSTPHHTVASTLKSFLPHHGEMCKKINYSTSNTATGRLTVLSGPQILTAPADSRKCLKSRYPEGKVLQIDLISAEPKFALQLKGGDVPVDVYSYVAKHILDNKVERHHAKLITLCALYGQSSKNLEKNLPEGVNAREVIRQTRRYFNYDYLKSRLTTEMTEGNFRNAIGRPIKIENNNDHLLISYYLQSSVAESSILLFF